jgi:PadR family transcriptional regulator, regulatory protein PadR
VRDSSLVVLRGTLDLLILKALSWGPAHGYAVAEWIERVTTDTLQIEEGSLYPALHRLDERGLIEAEWGVSGTNRRAKYYELTTKGRQSLKAESESWARYARAVFSALEAPAALKPARA